MSRRNLEAKFGDHRDRFARPEYFANTMGLADSCNVTITTDGDYFPIFSRHNNSDDLLKEVAYEGMERLGFQNEEEYVERLEEELAVIKRLNFSNYMLLVWDVVHYAKSSDIMVGPGRGSVGGSLLAYVLGITEVDPIVENLLFWRFLNVAVKYEPRFEAIIS
jgi:DNA polymerase-3 subunit alpha